ncbi:CBS domain-containing protein [Marinobacterium sp. D7]|uniref:CBS domain-containing protein n=1 Tax=Marinobacterium ramblicola TaxID=2849041 RepID=UPI001C2DD761|nr:CBS domain-containing protein [Marinobacterium ramblicola]MBV1787901.1 CBS domain-containing protein [Marinobacterium ramblicola]
MLDQKRVRDLMLPVARPLTGQMALSDAVELILASGQMGLPVIDENRAVVGFLSEHDCLRYLVSSSYYCDSRIQVADIMHHEPLCVAPGDSVLELAQQMSKVKPKNYPVVERGKLVGLITRRQVMTELNRMLRECKVAI